MSFVSMGDEHMGNGEAILLYLIYQLKIDLPRIDKNGIATILWSDQKGIRELVQGEVEEYFHRLRETRLLVVRILECHLVTLGEPEICILEIAILESNIDEMR